jgi:seryl-tRNA synthetase
MTPNERLTQVNKQLRDKRPAAKQAPVATNKPDTAAIRHRIEDVRKQIGVACEQAKKLGATELAAKIRALAKQLAGLEADLASISGTERRLVRMVKDFSH